MRIVDIKECAVHISRYPPFCAAPSTLTTSLVAVITDVQTPTGMLTGYGFSSFGRFAQSGLIRERFAPRLLGAADDLNDETGTNFDPFRAWDVMMKSEKPGGHGERCVAVGTLDMAIWDAAAKVAGLPLYRFLASRIPMAQPLPGDVPVYGAGGYQYPEDDIRHLSDEVRALRDLGCSRFKIKIGRSPLDQDVRRIEAVLELVSPDRLAVDAMHAYDLERSLEVADRLEPYGFGGSKIS